MWKRGAVTLWGKALALFPDHDVVLSSGDKLRCFRLSRRMQLAAVSVLAFMLLGLSAFILSMAVNRSQLSHDRAVLAAKGQAVASAESKVEGYRKSVEELARDLQQRQDFMDDLYRTHFGEEKGGSGETLVGAADEGTDTPAAPARKTEISAAPGAASLLTIDARQRRFALLLTRAVERRADKTAAAIRSFGLNPDALARTAARSQGGPFVPWRGQRDTMPDEFEDLAQALSRMEFLEASLMKIPSGLPTTAPMQSSSYGYRRDPFNGHAAFHAGIDFPGRHGQPILAAAAGKVSFVGQRSGYGNVVEVRHGNGLMTRYAHLSSFAVRRGQAVDRGGMIARMGSTGRSTGDHLHFEVRLNDQPINPRRFLNAAQDVVKVQQLAKTRLAGIGERG